MKCFQDRDGTLIKLSARKDPVASYVLGEIFTSDELRPLVLPDLKLAFRHYEISSEAGYAPSAVQLALFKIHSLISGNQDNVVDEQQNGIDTLESLQCRRTYHLHIIIQEGLILKEILAVKILRWPWFIFELH